MTSMKPFPRVALAALLSLSACGDDAKDTTPRDDAGNPIAGPDGSVGDAGTVRNDGGSNTDSGLDLTITACTTNAAPVLPALNLQPVVENVDRLIYAAQAPGSSDWYLLRQKGLIEIFADGQRRATPFLDVHELVTNNPSNNLPSTGAEYGLLGLAFAPDYQTSGLFYVMITPVLGDNSFHDQIWEYKRSSTDPNQADLGSKRLLLDLPSSAENHNGGRIAFGPDGMLYVGTGDGGGSCNDNKPNAPQDPTSLYGKILRLDPKAAEPYAAAGNPISGSGASTLVWHYGLRNPFSFSHDFANGDLYIGDVGQDRAEEIDFASADQKGLNFGWPAVEGDFANTCGNKPQRGDPVAPILSIDRRAGDQFSDYKSVIAGHVYRGHEAKLSGLRGAFFFGDYEGKRMGFLRHCDGKTSPVAPILKKRDANDTSVPGFGGSATLSTLSAIVQDNTGELYVLANFSSLLKIVPAN